MSKDDKDELTSPATVARDYPFLVIVMLLGFAYFVIRFLLPIALGN